VAAQLAGLATLLIGSYNVDSENTPTEAEAAAACQDGSHDPGSYQQ
jgi:hypothetical protein